MNTDKDYIQRLIEIGGSKDGLAAARATAVDALKEVLSEKDAKKLKNGCAATLSALLRQAGIDVSMTLGAGRLAHKLGGPGTNRGWTAVPVGQQQPGDVGVAFDFTPPDGADHVYLVVERKDDDLMLIADNQGATQHERSARGKDGRTRTEYFLRAAGYAPPAGAGGFAPVAQPANALLLPHLMNMMAGFGGHGLEAAPAGVAPANTGPGVQRIVDLAAHSSLMSYDWRNRGRAPKGYIKGMAVMYARVYCALKAGDAAAVEMAKGKTADEGKDALAYLDEEFQDAGMHNNASGKDTLRHLFVLLTGLGMRESSGRYCEGRDRAANNTGANTAEAGMFQTSYNARTASPLMLQLIGKYENTSGFKEIFREQVTATERDLENFGTGAGRDFQRLSKACPAFAVEFAAVGLRNVRDHWGPINRRAAEIRPECNDLFRQVENLVDSSNLCPI